MHSNMNEPSNWSDNYVVTLDSRILSQPYLIVYDYVLE